MSLISHRKACWGRPSVAHWAIVNTLTFAIHRTSTHRADTWSELSCTKRWNGLLMYQMNNSVFCVYFFPHGVCALQISLHGLQRLSAVLPGSASSPAAGAQPPLGPLFKAGGAKSGRCGRPRLQLEGWAHDASDFKNSPTCLSNTVHVMGGTQ